MNLNKKIKVICFDYDGTLVDFNGQMSSYTKKALILLKKNGYKLSLVSGRPAKMAMKAVSEFVNPDIFDYVFGINGIEYFDRKENKSEFYKSFSSDELVFLAKLYDNPDIMIVSYDDKYFNYNHEYETGSASLHAAPRKLEPRKIDFSSINENKPKLVLYNSENKTYEIDEFINKISTDFSESFRSSNRITEVVPKGCGKFLAIDKICEIDNINKNEIMAFGDQQNDISMLNNCVGVAMGNALDEVKAICTYQTDDINREGIYSFLKEMSFIVD